MADEGRRYDLVLFGASGYTGKYTAERLARQAPTTLRWAVAGRSAAKLEAVLRDLKPLSPDRSPPAVEVCGLDAPGLGALAGRTRVLINAVGPYTLYGEPVLRACVEQSTHYLDTTGEVAWVKRMIEKYEAQAKRRHAIVIPQAGLESAMPDLLALQLVEAVRREFGAATANLTAAVKLKSTPSGGTLATLLEAVSNMPQDELAASQDPFCLVPANATQPLTHDRADPLRQRLLGLRRDADLGLLTTSVLGATNAAIVHRSAAQLRYGPRFRYREHAPAAGPLRGVAAHWGLALLFLVLRLLAPARWLARRVLYAPGGGPGREATAGDSVEYRAVAAADDDNGEDPRRRCVAAAAEWKGSMYDLSGLYLAAAAMTLLAGDRCFAVEEGGGFLTPAALGQGFVERARAGGVRMETKIMEEGLPRFAG